MFGNRRDRTTDDWTLDMGLPEGWLILPLRPELTDAPVGSEPAMAASELWARETADALLGADSDPDAHEQLSEILVVHLRMAWEESPMFAGVFVPYPERGVEAVASVTPAAPELGTDLDAVRRIKEQAHQDLIKPREFREVTLPMGPALLAYELFRQEDDGPDLIVEGVVYWCTVPPVGRLVVVSVHWQDLAIGDDLQEHAEVLANSLEFVAL
jgi:hypothetical protein